MKGRHCMKKAIIFRGGWEGHEPREVSLRIGAILEKNGIKVDIYDGVQCLSDKEKLMEYDLIVPCITMGEISDEYVDNLSYAVSRGVGIAGCHGGMCDAFRNSTTWQFITGGQWVAHPGNDGVRYTVNVRHGANAITLGIEDFEVCSEQYYMHVDPAIEVLATTRFLGADGYHTSNKPIDMPVAWTKFWGKGRVFYCSLGHHADLFDLSKPFEKLMEQGMIWASMGKYNQNM